MQLIQDLVVLWGRPFEIDESLLQLLTDGESAVEASAAVDSFVIVVLGHISRVK
jgi:hypothetical protein